MAAFRILNQAPQYFLEDGRVNAGGKLAFYETDLTTPKNTWSDEALSVLNSNPVVMDAAGRTLTDVWGDGEYGVVMLDANDVVIWTRNNVRSDEVAGSSIPALVSGEFLTNNGSILQWEEISQVPDPTGQTDKVLKSDGAISFWGALPDFPDVPADGIDNTTTTFRIGNLLVQVGSDTFPASGSFTSTKAVTFGEAFNAAPVFIGVQMGLGTTGYVMTNVASQSATGFTAGISTIGAGSDIVAPQPFRYIAVGPVTP